MHAELENVVIPEHLQFADEAQSGATREREGLNAMLASAAAGQFKVIYFFSLSRLARKLIVSLNVLYDLVHVHGVRIISVSEGIDSNRQGWQIVAALYSYMHEQQLEELKANVLRGLEGTLLDGYSVGDYRFGYASEDAKDGSTRKRAGTTLPRRVYKIVSDESEWVVRIFTWFVVDEKPLVWIVRELNRLQVPKGHRAQSPVWSRANVISILRSEKYIGRWAWGIMTNQRDPKTGETYQTPRNEDEVANWRRKLPELRIVSDDLYFAAQELLNANEDRFASFRRDNGRLIGSDGSNGRRHLLHRLLCCEECGRFLYAGGTGGRYLYCPGYRDGVCSSRRQLLRKLARTKVLDVVVGQLLQDPAFTELVHVRLHAEWSRRQEARPAERITAEAELAECRRQITAYVESIGQTSNPDPAIHQKLDALRKEEAAQNRRLAAMTTLPSSAAPEPTREWVDQRLRTIGYQLRDDDPLAAAALKQIVGGSILVRLQTTPTSKRPYWQAEIRMAHSGAAMAVTSGRTPPEVEPDETPETVVFVDLREESESERKAKTAWDLLSQGFLQKEIATTLGVVPSRAASLLKLAARLFGKGISLKSARRLFRSLRAPKPAAHLPFVERAGELFEQGWLYSDIATELGTHRDMVTDAIGEWFRQRGMEAPDGRSRRKSLSFKGKRKGALNAGPAD